MSKQDSVLKRQFSEKDIQRIRNIVKGKSGSKTTQSVGYSKKSQGKHEEGDIWEEGGKTWTIKDGIKENITKLDKFKKAAVPLFCPECKGIMNKQLDSSYFKSYGQCLDCTKALETRIKLSGKWDEHVKENHNKQIDNLISEYLQFVEDKLNESNDSFVTEQGDVENWLGGIDKERLEKTKLEVLEYLNSLKK